MGRNKDGVQEFLDGIPDDKFCNWATKQYTIKEDYKLGMRLDHQGMDKDGTHRIYMQPLKGGETRKISGLKTSNYIAQVHSPDPGTPADVRAALMESVKGSGKLINANPGGNHGHENHGLASGLEDGLM